MNTNRPNGTGNGGAPLPASPDVMRAAALERRYRELLRWYPPSQREEMLGVLLDSARPGQRSPGVRQTANLVLCGLAIQARRALSRLAGERWQDALAVVSVIVPALMLAFAVLGFALAVWYWQQLGTQLEAALSVLLWLAVLLLGLTGHRRTAAAITVLVPFMVLSEMSDPWYAWFRAYPDEARPAPGFASPVDYWVVFHTGLWQPLFLASLTACSLVFSAGPRTGLALLGRCRAARVLAGLFVSLGLLPSLIYLSLYAPWLFNDAVSFFDALLLAIAAFLTCLRRVVDWRVTLLLSPLPLLAEWPLQDTAGFLGWLTGQGSFLPALPAVEACALALTVLVWPLAIASWRGRDRIGQTPRAAAG